MRIIRSISFAIASSLYGIIPSIYDLFIRIASTEFFTADAIQEVSNNFYILISVCMLFAFGIKLISVIVNPDLFEDKKKGPAKTFVNAVIAVVLITVTPMAFKFMYQVQNNVVQNHIIEKIVFGLDPDTDIKAGNILAAYTFRAFCYPNVDDSTMSGEVSSPSATNYSKVLEGDMSSLDEFGDDINNKTNGEWDYQYHILLSPLAAGYVAYELLLMTIDVAFRSVKLGLLQFIAPLVIIGFIFSGTDLLTRWLKEIVSTFVLLFAKMASIVFIIYGLSKFDEFIQNASVSDSIWLTGFIRVILLIALLQLIKKLPDILNKIFGTDIKLSGGLGDRLSEMAGIGGLAKSALDKVKPLAGKALAGAGLIASGPLGWGAAGAMAGGAGALVHGWKNGFRGHAPLKDSEFGRRVRTVGSYAKGIGKGLTAKGGIVKSVQEGTKAFGETEIGKQIQTERVQARQDRASALFRDKINAEAKRLGATGDVIVANEDGTITYKDPRIAQQALANVLRNDKTLNMNDAQRANAANLFHQKGVLGTLEELKGQKEKILTEITNSQNSLNKSDANYQAKYDRLESLKGSILNGGKTSDQLSTDIKGLLDNGVITELAANNMGTGLRKIMAAITNSDINQATKDLFINTNGLDLSNKNLLNAITDQNNTIAGLQADYDQAKEGATADAKALLGRYENNSNNINGKAVFEEQSARNLPQYDYKYTAPANQGGGNTNGGSANGATINVNNLNTNNVNAQNVNGAIPPGYSETSSGIVLPTNIVNQNSQTSSSSSTVTTPVNTNSNVGSNENTNSTPTQDMTALRNEISGLSNRIRELQELGTRASREQQEELADLQSDMEKRIEKLSNMNDNE